MRNNFLRPLSKLMLFLGLLLVGSGCERAKTKLDREVDRLCAIDGGVKIYERVTLSAENFGPNGEVFPQYQHLTSKGRELGPEYEWASEVKKFVEGDPSLIRRHQKVVRIVDRKLLGERIYYVRNGGDFYSFLSTPSSYSCIPAISNVGLLTSVFVKGTKS